MTESKKILVADDDPHIREVVRFAAEQAGFEVVEAEDGAEALEVVEADVPDLVVLDIMMPEMDGTDVCREIRRDSDVPVIFLTSKDDEIDRVVGLELGGDDYVTKPFSPRELVARMKAIFRRVGRESDVEDAAGDTAAADSDAVVEHGKLRLDRERFEAYWDDESIDLTKTEFELVDTLLGHPGKVYSRNELMDGAYDPGVVVSDRTIDSHVRKARRKFKDAGANPIETVRGVGYKLGDCT